MTNINRLSVQDLMFRLNIDKKQAQDIKALVSGKIDPLSFSDVSNWVNQCYNMPEDLELILCAINQVIEGFGVEYIESKYDDIYESNGLGYVNLGNTYINTVIYNHSESEWIVASYGDIVESNHDVYLT